MGIWGSVLHRTNNNPIPAALGCLVLLLALLPTTVPASDSEALRGVVEELETGFNPRGVENTDAIVGLYAERNNRFLWFGAGPLASARDALLQELLVSSGHGFNPARYHYQALADAALSEAELEVLYTDALLSQIRHRAGGVMNGQEVEWDIPAPPVDTGLVLQGMLDDPATFPRQLRDLWPRHPDYWALVARRAEISAQPDTRTATIPDGPLLRLGDEGARVQQLQLRLLGPGEYSGVFDEELRAAVRELQRTAGLEPDGIVGPATLEVLNATRHSWIDRLDANLERWRWLPRQIPDTFIRVNIAAFNLRAVENGRPALDMDVIVGRPYRQTPVFTETLKYLVFYPYWNVPNSIAKKDKLPLLRRDPEPMALSGFQARMAGNDSFVPVDALDWQTVRPGTFLLRQLPGEGNALGRVKFMLPNPYDVYLHDTPDKGLFGRSERVFSSGCIRVAQPVALAQWVLRLDGNPRLPDVERLYRRGPTTTVYLRHPIPVVVVYFTAFVDQGRVVFRRDIYDRDAGIVRELRAGSKTGSEEPHHQGGDAQEGEEARHVGDGGQDDG